MSSLDWIGPRDAPSPSIRTGTCEGDEPTGLRVVPCTIRDVAQLAGVSIATVSRVTNGATNVSGMTAAKVLAAASQLRYSPNALAAELARGNGGNARTRNPHRSAMEGLEAKQSSSSAARAQEKRHQTEGVRLLENEYSRERRMRKPDVI